ncbi:MAG: DUF4163 domain-containing protein [Lachnospiraceae bacterium]|nr:DUF4163 domain-containing protein [Lachnospiraceae bacterium]
MKKRFRRKWKRIVVTILLVSICTACGKAQEDHMAADIADRAALGAEQAVEMEAAVRTVGESVTNGEEAVQTAETSAIEETETSESGESTATEMSEDENKEAGWDVDFEIKREAYHYNEERNDINIYYPQLTGFGDAIKEERINALIEENAKKWIGETNKEGDDSLYCLNLDYKVKFLNDRIISILYKGGHGYITAGHGYPAKAVATTIDMEEEKVIALKDIITDFSELSDMLLADKFESITRWEGMEGIEFSRTYESKGRVEQDLTEAKRQWYTNGDHLIIIFEKFNDYDEYSISIGSVSQILDETFLKKLE